MKFQTSLFLLAALVCTPSPTLARNKPVTPIQKSKDTVTKKEAAIYDEPKSSESRISRSSLYSATLPAPASYKLQNYQQPYSYPLVLSPQYTAAASLALASLAQSQKQPKKPVYHATPLQSYGTLIDQVSLQQPKSVVLGSDSAATVSLPAASTHLSATQYAADYSASYNAALKEAVESASKLKLGEVALPDIKYSVPDVKYSVPEVKYAASEVKYSAPEIKYSTPEVKYSAPVYKQVATSSSYREDEDKHDEYAAKYQFGYQVRDPKHGSYFGHSEARDGHVTKGHYHVLLPDGRLQNVQYYADLTGFHAQVSYNGVAKHTHSPSHAA